MNIHKVCIQFDFFTYTYHFILYNNQFEYILIQKCIPSCHYIKFRSWVENVRQDRLEPLLCVHLRVLTFPTFAKTLN